MADAPYSDVPSDSDRAGPYLDFSNPEQVPAARSLDESGRALEGSDWFRAFGLQVSLAQERERQRIAVGLHDEIGQNLGLVAARLDELTRSAASEDDSQQAAEIRALVDRTIKSVRSLTFDLASPVLHMLGLGPAIRSLGEQLERDRGVRFRFASDGEAKTLSEEAEVIVYRCARQLLRNIGEHAQARLVTVRMTAGHEEIAIEVQDDGVGFDPFGTEPGRDGGFGLYSIAEQMEFVGGRLEISSGAKNGTHARLVAPCIREGGAP